MRDLHSPWLSSRVDYFAYSFFCSMLAFVFVLGTNAGSYLTYAFQLILPPFFLWLIGALKARSRLAFVVVPVLLLNLLFFCQKWLGPALLGQLNQSAEAWTRLSAVVDRSNRTLNSPILAADMIEHGLWPLDSGQTEYYFGTMNYPWSRLVGPDQTAINNDGEAYLNSIRISVRKQEFARIVVTEEPWPQLFKYGLLREHYHPTQSFSILMPLIPETWIIRVWEPGAE